MSPPVSRPCRPLHGRMWSRVAANAPEPCIGAMGAAALGLALGDPVTEKGCALISLNLAFQR